MIAQQSLRSQKTEVVVLGPSFEFKSAGPCGAREALGRTRSEPSPASPRCGWIPLVLDLTVRDLSHRLNATSADAFSRRHCG
jgi:hypothetical protein